MRFRVPILGNPELQANFEQVEEETTPEWTKLPVAVDAQVWALEFWRDLMGFVVLRGRLNTAKAEEKIIATLPVGYRPRITPHWQAIPAFSGSGPGYGYVYITEDGKIRTFTAQVGEYSLAGVRFLAEQ